ncbi:MAG: GIY-YIG nuclease family protein [Hyphomicrobium sp.]|jgi:putative endonuclease
MASLEGLPAVWHLYLIECVDGTLYTGITTDVARRYQQHCSGKGAKYTRARPPARLVGSHPCGDRSAALKAEHALRQLSRAGKVAHFAAAVE